MAEASLKLGGDWGVKEGSLLGFNDQNGNYKPIPFDFTRATTATRVNRDGLIEEVQAGVPRIDFSSGDGSLLLEPQRTNNVTYSEEFDNVAWQLLGLGVGSVPSITANYAISPDGTQNADRIQFNLNSGTTTSDRSIIRQLHTSQTDYYFSCYIKSTNGSEQKLLWHFGGDDYEFTVTNEWQRFELNRNGSATGAIGLSLRGAISSVDTADVLVYGMQLEQGSYHTSLIKTSGSAVTRNADVCNNGETTFNDSEGVLYAEIAALVDDSSNKMISISNGTNSTRILIRYINDFFLVQLRISGVNQYEFSDNLTDITDYTKIAFKYKQNDFSVFINGSELDSSNSGSTFSAGTLTELSFDDGGGNNDFYGNCKEIRVYNTALTDTELQELTTI